MMTSLSDVWAVGKWVLLCSGIICFTVLMAVIIAVTIGKKKEPWEIEQEMLDQDAAMKEYQRKKAEKEQRRKRNGK